MLLSSSNSNFRMMDEFVDQDWFEEPEDDEVVKQHLIEQQSPLRVPDGCFQTGQIHGLNGDFLELNVPVDENTFFASNEMTDLSQCVDPQQSLLIRPTSFDSQPSSSTLSSQTRAAEKQQPDQREGSNGESIFIMENIGTIPAKGIDKSIQGQPRYYYSDSSPSTSYTVMQNPEQHKPQGWTSSQRQTQRYARDQRIGGHRQSTLTGNDVPMSRIIVRDHSANQTQLQQNMMIYPRELSIPENFIITQEQQQHSLEGEKNPVASQHFHQTSQSQLTISKHIDRQSMKKSSKPKSNNNVNNRGSTQKILQQNAAETNLDQIANMLFTNSNLATVQFNPQQASEFAKILDETKLLKEQEDQGIDVNARLKACEARIAQILMSNTMSQSDSQNSKLLVNGSAKKQPSRNRAKRKSSLNLKGNITLQHPSTITIPENVIYQEVNYADSKPYHNNSIIPPTTSSPSFSQSSSVAQLILHNDSPMHSYKKESKVHFESVISTNKERKLTKKSAEQILQEKEAEKILRLKEEERRRMRLSDKFIALRSSIKTINYERRFEDRSDYIKRLLPFGLLEETIFDDNFLNQYNGELQRHSKLMDERVNVLQHHFRSICFRESMCKMNEQKNLLLHLDYEYERNRLLNDIEKSSNSSNVRQIATTRKTELEWEYDANWSSDKFLNISPFTPSSLSEINEDRNKIVEEEEELCSRVSTQFESINREENSFVQITIPPTKLATVRVQLHYTVTQECFSDPEVHSKNSNTIHSVDEIVKQKDALESTPIRSLVTAQSTSTVDEIKPNDMLNTELKIENMLTDINEELIADNIAKNSQMTLDKIPISPSEKTEFNKDNTDVVAPQKQTEEQNGMPEPVKLKIKIGKKEYANGNSGKNQRTELDKQERKRQKAERKEIKKQAKLERESIREMQKQSCSSSPKQPSLKISLSRLACWRETEPGPKRENPYGGEKDNAINQNRTTIKDAEIGENGRGEGLKLRISKLILNKPNGEMKNEDEKPRKGKKRKSSEKEQSSAKNREISSLPAKIPRLKIRIGNPANEPNFEDAKTTQNPEAKLRRSDSTQAEITVTNTSNVNSQIQFSPCCSEGSDDDELRHRTNELFSKLAGD